MSSVVKMFVLLIIVGVIAVLAVIGVRVWLGNQGELQTELTGETATSLTLDLPEELSVIAEEEYAIEFEAEANEPVEAINMDLCDLVKSQCEEQGIEDCEDYEMCVEGVRGD